MAKVGKSMELSVLWQVCDFIRYGPFSLLLNCWCFLEFNSWLSYLFTPYKLPNLIHNHNFRFLLNPYDSQILSGSLNNVHNCFLCVCPSAIHEHVCSVMFDSLQPMDYSLPGSTVHGIPQAKMLEQVAISSSRGSFRPRDRICISCLGRWILLPLNHLGNP